MITSIKTVVAARDTSLSHIKSALGRSLEKRLAELPEAQRATCYAEIQQFLTAFPNVRIKMGEALLMWKSDSGDVYVVRPDHEPVRITSDFVGRALLAVYLDSPTSIPQVPSSCLIAPNIVASDRC